jgi:hypothetical protein
MSVFGGFKFWIGKALADGALVVIVLALLLGLSWWLERRTNKTPHR